MSNLENFGSKKEVESENPKNHNHDIYCYFCAHCGQPNTGQCCTYPLDSPYPISEAEYKAYLESVYEEIRSDKS